MLLDPQETMDTSHPLSRNDAACRRCAIPAPYWRPTSLRKTTRRPVLFCLIACSDIALGAVTRLCMTTFRQVGDNRARHNSIKYGLVRRAANRSEEHTSELQSLTNLVCRL